MVYGTLRSFAVFMPLRDRGQPSCEGYLFVAATSTRRFRPAPVVRLPRIEGSSPGCSGSVITAVGLGGAPVIQSPRPRVAFVEQRQTASTVYIAPPVWACSGGLCLGLDGSAGAELAKPGDEKMKGLDLQGVDVGVEVGDG